MDKNYNVKIIDFDLLAEDSRGNCFGYGYHISPPEELERCIRKSTPVKQLPVKHSVILKIVQKKYFLKNLKIIEKISKKYWNL
jgi:hypothetical protein